MAKKSMADIWKEMEKQHGDEGLYAGNSNMVTYSDAIPTGSHALDDALGIWGIPKGHVVQYAGFESSGKTLLSLTTIAEWQKLDPNNWAMFIDAEFSYVKEWAESIGVDTSRLYVYRENRATKVFDRIIGIPNKNASKTGEIKKVKPGILDIELETGGTGLGLIVLDSVPALQPPAEETSRAGKENMSLMARFLPPVLRKLTPLLTATGVSFIAINQLKFVPGVMYGDPTTTPGGTALKHACSQMINLGVLTSKDNKIFVGDHQIGHKIRAKIQKNKKAPPFRTADFWIKYDEGIVNQHDEIRDIGARYGVIERPNNKVWLLDGVKYNGKDAMSSALDNDKELCLSVLSRAKEAKQNNISINNVQDEENETIEDNQEEQE